MDKKFNTIMRSGKAIDMIYEIETLQEKYLTDLKASVACFDSYDEVSAETLCDFNATKYVLLTLEKLGYLFKEECEEMIKEAEIQRKQVLKELEVIESVDAGKRSR